MRPPNNKQTLTTNILLWQFHYLSLTIYACSIFKFYNFLISLPFLNVIKSIPLDIPLWNSAGFLIFSGGIIYTIVTWEVWVKNFFWLESLTFPWKTLFVLIFHSTWRTELFGKCWKCNIWNWQTKTRSVSAVNYYRKKFHRTCLTGFWIRLWKHFQSHW